MTDDTPLGRDRLQAALTTALGGPGGGPSSGAALHELAGALASILERHRVGQAVAPLFPRDDGVVLLELRTDAPNAVSILGFVWWADQAVSPLLVDLALDKATGKISTYTLKLADPAAKSSREEVERAWRRGQFHTTRWHLSFDGT